MLEQERFHLLERLADDVEFTKANQKAAGGIVYACNREFRRPGNCRMNNNRKQKLIDLGAETLVDALLDLAVHSGAADDMIERLIASPKENVQRFNSF